MTGSTKLSRRVFKSFRRAQLTGGSGGAQLNGLFPIPPRALAAVASAGCPPHPGRHKRRGARRASADVSVDGMGAYSVAVGPFPAPGKRHRAGSGPFHPAGFSELIADVRPWGLGKKFKNASAFDVRGAAAPLVGPGALPHPLPPLPGPPAGPTCTFYDVAAACMPGFRMRLAGRARRHRGRVGLPAAPRARAAPCALVSPACDGVWSPMCPRACWEPAISRVEAAAVLASPGVWLGISVRARRHVGGASAASASVSHGRALASSVCPAG